MPDLAQLSDDAGQVGVRPRRFCQSISAYRTLRSAPPATRRVWDTVMVVRRFLLSRSDAARAADMARNWRQDPLPAAASLELQTLSRKVMQELRVDVDQALAASRALGNDAVELGEELDNLKREWENLARGWSGVASSTYSDAWGEWLEGAATLVDALAERSRNIGQAAVRYAEQDVQSGEVIGSVQTDLHI